MYEAQLVNKTDGILNLLLRLRRDPYKKILNINLSEHITLLRSKDLHIYIHISPYCLHIFTYNCLQLLIKENVNLQNFQGCEVIKTGI